MRRTLAVLAIAISAFAGFAEQTYAQLPTFVRKIDSPPPLNSRSFGYSFGSFNGNLLVGSPEATDAAYLMDLNTGARLVTMTSPDAGNGEISFGGSVAQVGQNIVVGDQQYDASSSIRRSGSAYVFNGSTGQHLLTIRNPTPQTSDNFGASIQTIGGNIWINSQSTSTGSKGKIHIFSPTSGQLVGTIANPDLGSSWGFGFKFLEHKEDVFISAVGGSFAHLNAGAVYRYDKNTLELKQKIYNPFPQSSSNFGWSLADSEEHLLIGARSQDKPNYYADGQAYLFSARTGTLLRTLSNPEPEEFAGFGTSVALAGDYAFVGGPNANSATTQSAGAFFVFDVNSGNYLGKVLNPEPEQSRSFTDGWGNSGGLIDIGDKLVAASYLNGPGSVYVYSLTGGGPVGIPEPSTFALLAFGGLIAIVGQRRKFAKKT